MRSGSSGRRLAAAAATAWCALLLHAGSARAQVVPPPPPDTTPPAPPAPPAPPSNTTKTDSRCGAECVRCAADGCVRCARLLLWQDGSCVGACPAGSHEAWATGDRLMGRVCYPDDYYNEALVGGCAGLALCLVLGACGATYARCRRRRRGAPRAHPLPLAPPPGEDSARLRDFHKQLDCLRPHAYTLLSILNNTRRQVRELYLLGNNDAAMAYSCVLSDLAKLLLLLNKKNVPVVPEEWPRLASWAERILKRYNRVTCGGSGAAQAPLVELLQPEAAAAGGGGARSPLATFKPPAYASASYGDHLFEKQLDMQAVEMQWQWGEQRPPSYSLVERETVPLAAAWGRHPLARRESVWLEDEHLKLARPQDELTTEL